MSQPLPRWGQNIEIALTSALILAVGWLLEAFYPNAQMAVPIATCLLIINLMRFAWPKQVKECMDFLIRWRWLFALLVFTGLVALEIHTSSAAAYSKIYTAEDSVLDSVLFGQYQPSRTDEYNVQLPYYFSQFYNNYQEISHQMSVGGQNMIIGYNAPAFGLAMLAKPQTWGFLLFGNAQGLAWYFSFKNVACFMAGFEAFLILTRSKYMAVFGAFLLLYAPGMQWWFSPHFFDVIMWSLILFVCGYYFCVWHGWKQWGMTFLSIFTLTGFALALFPSLQVPCGLLMFFLLIACLIRDRHEIHWRWTFLFNILTVLIGVGALLGSILWGLKDDLMLLMETAYPGHRVSVGGYGRMYQLFMNEASPLQPLRDSDLLNNSEFSTFNHYGIGVMIAFPVLAIFQIKEKKRSVWIGLVFFLAMAIEMFFLLVGVSEEVATATLLSMCNRMHTVYGLTAAMFTVWFTREIYVTKIPWKPLFGFIVAVIYGWLSSLDTKSIMMPSFVGIVGKEYFVWMPVVLAFVFFLCFTRWRQLFFAFMTGWTVLSGCTINPVVQGIAAVTDYPLVEAARKCIDEDPDAWWLTLDNLTTGNLLLANGAKVLNATNFYPDFEKWKLIDPSGRFLNAVNRYANMAVILNGGDEPTKLVTPSPDRLNILLNPADLEKLDVTYLVGSPELGPVLGSYGISAQGIYTDVLANETIYKLSYDENAKIAFNTLQNEDSKTSFFQMD